MTTTVFDATIDSKMDGLDADTNHGSSIIVTIGQLYIGIKTTNMRGIVNFDVSALSGHTINTAKLIRYVNGVVGGGFAAHIYRCTRPSDWVEGEVTWNDYKSGTSWTAGGGDYDITTPTPIAYNEAGSTGSHEIEGLAGFVTDALANRSGIVSLIARADNEAPGSTKIVDTRSIEYSGNDEWKLEVDHTPPGVLRGHGYVIG